MVRDLETKYSYPIAGTLRVGEKKGNRPTSLNYFTVHEDSHTTSDVIEKFNGIFGEKPKEIIIKFLSDDPFKVDYLRYAKSGLQCIGDGEKASYKNKDNNEWCNCECSKDCKFRGNECKLTGRLDFVIKDVNIGGLWRFQTRSYTTITNFLRTLNFLKCMNHDIKNSYFKLIVEENVTNVGGETRKFITLNLKEIVDKEQFINKENVKEMKNEVTPVIVQEEKETAKLLRKKKTVEQKKDESNIQQDSQDIKIEKIDNNSEIIEVTTDNNVDDFEKCLSLIEINDLKIKDKMFKEATFCNMKDETVKLIIHPSILDEVSTWEIGSAIIPIDIMEKNKYKTLVKYKDLGIIKKQKAD